jgi:hypothetical protein
MGFSRRPADEIEVLFKAAYGRAIDLSRVCRGLDVVAEALNRGDLGRAMVATLRLRLREPEGTGARLLAAVDAALAKDNPNVDTEPRDQLGRWTVGAAATSGGNARSLRTGQARRTRAARQPYPRHSATELPVAPIPPSKLTKADQKSTSRAVQGIVEGTPTKLLAWELMEDALGLGSDGNPGPGRLVAEWRTGRGPQTRVLAPESSFSRQFATAPSTQRTVDSAIGAWKRRPGGFSGADGRFQLTGYRGVFGPTAFVEDAWVRNAAAHVIGSYSLSGIVDRDVIHWQAVNNMDIESFAGGHWLEHINVPADTLNVDRPLPFGTTRQIIRWDTTLTGEYIAHRKVRGR